MQHNVVGVVQDPEPIGGNPVIVSNRLDGLDRPPNPRRTVVIDRRRSEP